MHFCDGNSDGKGRRLRQMQSQRLLLVKLRRSVREQRSIDR